MTEFVLSIPRFCADEFLLVVPPKMLPSLLICENGANLPLSSYKHAIKYTPGLANVESTHLIDSIIPLDSREIILGVEAAV